MYEFYRGPMMWAALIVCITGIIRRIILLTKISEKKINRSQRVPGGLVRPPLPRKGQAGLDMPLLAVKLKGFLPGNDPLLAVITVIFHSCLIVTPLFLRAHNVLLFNSWRFSFVSLPEGVSDILTIIVVFSAMLLFARRIFIPRVRAIAAYYDHLLLLVATAPFITGFLAYHQLFDYETVILAHIISGEVMLMALGWTKLGHMVFFFFSRFFISSEYSFGRGSRTWVKKY